jgi:hypothetical protein
VIEYAIDFLRNRNRSEDNHMGVVAGWANVTLGHWRHSRAELLNYRLGCTASLADIAVAAALETDVVGHIDVNSSAKMMP